MEFRLNSVYGSLLLLMGTEILWAAGATIQNRCDKNIQVVTKSECHSCSITSFMKCPNGYNKEPPGKSNKDCRYSVTAALTFAGCSFECIKDAIEPQCCPGYWGIDCIECPGSAASPCSNNGVCSVGMGGNGKCTCKPGFVGTACEDCGENLYGQTCSNVCQCKHGLCDSGIKGTGQCTCLSGYAGVDCTRELPACASLRCGPDARCVEEISTGQLVCKCKPGYQGDGVRCTSMNPCLRSVCHVNASCVHTGPNQHVCTCTEGYSGDGHVCMPIDPCQTNLGDCPSSSTRCVYDRPGKAHCECLEGFEKFVEGKGCSIKDVCRPASCHKYATCATVVPGTVECKCRDGYLGNGKICLGNIIQQLQELNSKPGGEWTGQLSSAISLFDQATSWSLTFLGPFTVFVPVNKAFKGTSVKTLLANEMKARYLAKLHTVAGEVNFDSLKKGILYYTLTGLAGESLTDLKQIKIKIHGSRKKAALVETDIFASNGIIHLVDKLMDAVPSTVISEKEDNLLQILSKNGKFSQFKSLLEKTNMAAILKSPGPYTLFAPTNTAFTFLKAGYLDYLTSEEGKNKLLELLRNHLAPSSQLSASFIASNSHATSLANQVLTFNVTAAGQMLVNGEAILELDVEAANGRLHSVEGILIPASIEPVLPHRCDLTENHVYRGPCVSCTNPSKSICPTGERMNLVVQSCVYRINSLQSRIPIFTSGCAHSCNETKTTPLCCKGFFGPDCSPCPGGFSAPCSSHGKCSDAIDGNGTCQCEHNFKGSRCQYCANPNKYGPSCDKTCGCIHGVCDNRPEAGGKCKEDSCKDGYAGEFCEQQTQSCGPNQLCHAHAGCVSNNGALTCVCKPGFKGDGYMCIEKDPCALPNRGGCSVNAKCIKTGLGTHTCQCLSGWREDGDECQPINNCQDSSRGVCHPNATCIYVGPGQSDCACKNGYHGDGTECEPINQCVEQKGGCHYLATCQFMGQDGWQCVCEDDYAGDGIICYGTLAQEVATNPELLEFNKWLTLADVSQLLSETENFTLFVPSAQAAEKMSEDDKDFWLSRSNLPSLIKNHIVPGIFKLTDLRTTPSPQLASLLKKTLPVSSNNDSTIVAGGKFIYGDMAAKNGVIHLIDTVLISERKLSEGLLEVLNQRSDLSLYRDALTKHNLTDDLEESSGFTVFAPTDNAIQEYLRRTGKEMLDLNVTQYHIIVNETIKEEQLVDGLYKDSLLGFSYQLGFFRQDNKMFVNDAAMNTTNIETSKGVIHTVSAVLSIPNNRCDRQSTTVLPRRCMDCFRPAEDFCPSGTKRMMKPRRRCMYSRVYHGDALLSIGCELTCVKVTVERRCCAGFYGINCERCPGPEAQPCFGNGVCADGTNGTGVCQCNQNFNGTACENCQSGRYGIHCDQECKCVHGRCKDGVDGDGSCECDLGWRGIACNVAITSDMCGGKCHSSANCLLNEVDSTYYCKCAAGFLGNGTHCTAVDACAENNGGCSARALCKRTVPGQRICLCPPGYGGDGIVCISINPCLDGNNGGCHPDSDCIHTGPNKTTCFCKTGFNMVGNQCEVINLCHELNGGCHRYARCTMTGPSKRNCTCESGFVGDGETCTGSLQKELTNRRLRDFLLGLVMTGISALRRRGPFTVFVPNTNAFKNSEVKDIARKNPDLYAEIMRYHIVPCRSLFPEDLTQPRKLTTLTGDVLTVTYSEDTIYLNNKAKVVFSNLESSNGILHEIDTVLIPPSLQNLKPRKEDKTPHNLSDVVNLHGFKTFYKLLEDTDALKLVTDSIHQPVTLFLPTDGAMAALAQEQKDFLYAMHNREKLVEYLRYHILHDTKILPSELMRASSFKTQQGSDLSVACMGEEQIGEFYVNDKSCRIVKRNIEFNGGILYGINCLLNPLSLGGRCDSRTTVDITLPCRRCGRTFSDCPPGSKPKAEQKCDLTHLFVANTDGCQSICTMVIWKPKCCSGYFGRDCLACPGGPGSPCSNRGKCDEDHLGNGTCTCDAGFTGVACELCVDGRFGPDCNACNCTEHGSCDQGVKGSGSCFCEEGWTGSQCENKLADGPVCSPACHEKAVCMENNTCVCKPFYEGDGITCTAANMCRYWNGGCSKDAKCTQKGEKVSCKCLEGYSGDGFVCTPVDPCVADDNGGCHEHATCTLTRPGKKKCECKDNYIGDGIECELKLLPENRCLQDHGQCHSDAQCTDLHYEDKSLGVFHYRTPKRTYTLNYTMAQEACKEAGGTIATYTQLSYAQQGGYSLCAAGWLEKARVAYPMSFSNPKCGFGHVGIVDYGTRTNLSETWDVFCYRVNDVKCECKAGYIGDGYSCTGNLLQVLSTTPTFSNFYSQILNYSSFSGSGKEFVNHISNITIQSTLFVPDNNGLYSNQTLSSRDIEHHLLDGRALVLQALINVTHIRTRLGHSLTITRVPDLQNPQTATSSGYIDDQYVTDYNIFASNGVIHVLQGPLKAPPLPPPTIHPAHKAGMVIGVLVLIILIAAAGFVGCNFYTHKTKPFQFHYFKEDEGVEVNPSEPSANISNPVYESTPAPKDQAPTEDKHEVISSGSYDLLQDS